VSIEPRPDQQTDPPPVVLAPGGAAGVFRGRLVIVFGSGFSGVFVYSPKPGSGNLIASVAAAAGTDPYGNVYQAGVFSYLGGGFAGLASGTVTVEASGAVSAGSLSSPSGGQLQLDTGLQQGGDTRGQMFVYSLGGSPSGAPLAQLGQSMAIVASHPGGSTAETWQSLGTLSGFTVTRGRYRITPEGEVEFDVVITGGGANAATTSWSNTLPAAYRPAVARAATMATGRAVTAGDAWPRLTVSTGGTVQVVTVANISLAMNANWNMPMD